MWTLHLKAELSPDKPMRNTRNAVKVRSCQPLPGNGGKGFVMRHVSKSEADAMEAAPELGFVRMEDGSLQKLNYQAAREESPSVITPSETRMNVGESGEPKPLYLRRDGYVDPVEEARNKIQCWPEIGDVKKDVTFIMCPWPRESYTSFAP